MYLKEIFDQLAAGELAQTNLGTITEEKWPSLVFHVNLGLADLFKRFFLREGRHTLPLVSGQTAYPLNLGDLLKIEGVLTQDGVPMVMNDATNEWALTVTDTYPVTLKVPSDIVEQTSDVPEELLTSELEVIYRARHPKIDVEDADFHPDDYDVQLPDSHLQALLYYVASRVQGPMGMGQAEGMSGATYWQRYEAECAQLMSAGVQLDRTEGFDLLRDRGFA